MSWQLSIGVERVKCTHLDFSYRFFCCTSYFNLRNKNTADLTYEGLVDDGEKPTMEEVQVWECRNWGYMGNSLKVLKWVETEDEAQKWLDESARFDFEHDDNTPACFDNRAEAEEFLADISE